MASPFSTTGTQQGDIEAGLIMNGVYSPNIPVDKITPVSPVILPEAPAITDYNAILGSTKASLPEVSAEETALEDTQSKITSKTIELGGASAFQVEQEKLAGVPGLKKDLKNLQAKLTSINPEAQVATLNLDRVGTPTRLTSASNLDRSNIEKDRTIKALRVSSSIQAIQGNLSLANDQALRAVALKYDPIKTELETLTKQLEFNYKSFNAAEKKRADKLKEENAVKLKELEIERKASENWEKTKNDALADGTPLSIVNSAQQFFDANQEDKARSLIGSYVKPKTTTVSTAPLSILDIARYNEAYPDAGVQAGDTEAQANTKVQGLSAPKTLTDEDFRVSARDAKKEGLSYEQTIAEIEADPMLANKDRAKLVAGEIYGEKPKSAQQNRLENDIASLKKGGTLMDSDVRFALKQRGYTTQEINASSIGKMGASFIDSLTSFLFK